MPTTRRRTTRARTGTADGVPEEIYQAFTSGFGSLIGLDEGWKKRQTEAELRKAWKKYKDGPPKKMETEDIFEDNEQYLERLGLLESWEKEILNNADK